MRIDRMLSIVVILLNRRKITAGELADRFEVSLRTIYRDIESINISGIPVISNQGMDGGYEIPENYKLSRQYLSLSDLRSILTALKGINAALDDKEIELIFEKIQCLLPESEKTGPKNDTETLVFDTFGWGKQEKSAGRIQTLYEAIKNHRLIDILYLDGNGRSSQRIVEPMTLIQKGFSWYLFGFCRERKDFRLFKLTRMKGINELSDRFERRPGHYQDIATEWSSPEKNLEMVLKFSAGLRHRIEEYHEDSDIIAEDGDFITVKMAVPYGEWLLTTLLAYGPDVEILSPKFLRNKVKDRIDQMASLYKGKNKQSKKIGINLT